MVNQINQLNNQLATNLVNSQTIQDLSTSLTALKPDNSETTQLITYVLIGTVIAGLFVYHYIKSSEEGEPIRINLNFTATN